MTGERTDISFPMRPGCPERLCPARHGEPHDIEEVEVRFLNLHDKPARMRICLFCGLRDTFIQEEARA